MLKKIFKFASNIVSLILLNRRNTLLDGWMDGWVDGWMDGWKEGKAGLRIAYSNQK